MDLGLAERTALVCASTSGLGLATARALCEDGARVVVTSRSSDRAEEVAAALPSAIGIGCDLVAADGAARLFGESTSWVTKARSLGATWSQIGEALNCSGQAAWERFSVQE
jgi:3-oxoacyl-[acyl-carrier protein] reductase